MSYRIQIDRLLNPYPNFHSCYIDGMNVFYKSVKEKIASLSFGYDHVITTRLDNDDCIHAEFIDHIQSKFDEQEFMAIDLAKGYTLQIDPYYRLGKKEHLFNPFMSVIERNKSPRTVCGLSHTEWKRVRNVYHDFTRRFWLAVIHDRNKVNAFDGYGLVDWSTIRNEFHVSEEIDSRISHEIIGLKFWRMESLWNAFATKWTILNKRLKRNIGLYRLKDR